MTSEKDGKKIEDNKKEDIQRENRSLTILSILAIVVFIALASTLLGLWFSTENDKKKNQEIALVSENGIIKGTSTADPQYLANLADSLKNAGFILYGSGSDSNTKRQKEIFGQAFTALDYVECDPGTENSNPQECVAKGIDKYPTWVRVDQKFSGYKSLDELEGLLNPN